MLWYGTDKPDLRNPIRMQVVSEHFRGSDFKIFAGILDQAGTEVRAIPAPGGGSRKFCDRMNAFAQGEGLPGMGYIFWREGMEAAGPVAKALGPDRTEALRQQMGVGEGDAVFFLGGQPAKFEAVAGKARNVIGRELGLTQEDRFDFCWIVDFPMYERDEETGKLDFSHNPFSMPQGGLEALASQDPLDVLGYQYDIVCNGVELSSGAVRNHKPEVMYRAFEVVGHDRAFVDSHFGGMISAFRYGAPPHAGIAPGVDRIVMLLAGAENIREVIMFPMNQRAEDLMMGAPSEPSNEQLRELGMRFLPRE
jgi:aspartyl-tRNA synthetase